MKLLLLAYYQRVRGPKLIHNRYCMDYVNFEQLFFPGSQPSTPLRSPRPKVCHPVDVESCKEETEESTDSPLQPELDQTFYKDTRPISPDEEENLFQQKRKPSFKIDPEELRQLDRKLSLKIVEIERRKSSAGIESEELDSKVLFPFDRDYIQEGHKTIRGDTPTSIPDDRLCSLDDFSCDFEEETIPVPDIITTHKPFHQRMSSLEECDESKVNENVDADVIKNESFEENDCDFKSFSESGSSEENYGQESSHIDTKFNFDQLFLDSNAQKTGYGTDISIVSISNDNNILDFDSTIGAAEGQNPKIHGSTSDISTLQSTSPNTENKLDTDIGLELLSSEYLLNKISETTLTPITLITTNSTVQDFLKETKSCRFKQESPDGSSLRRSILESSSIQQEHCNGNNLNSAAVVSLTNFTNDSNSKPAVRKEFESETEMTKDKINCVSGTTTASIINAIPFCSKYSQGNLEKKLASLLPSIPIYSSLDTKIPDVAAVSSRDEEINLIRRKYANFSNVSSNSDTSEPLNREEVQEMVSNNVLVGSLIKTEPLENELDINFLEIKEGSTTLSDDKDRSSFYLQNEETTGLSILKTISDKELTLVNQIMENKINSDDNIHRKMFIHPAESEPLRENNMINENIEKEPQTSKKSLTPIDFHKSTDFQTPKDLEKPIVGCKFEKSQSKSLSSSPKRRGSEVALNMILKENSQILSKIQYQSRRNSEFSGDSTLIPEQNRHENEKTQENCDILPIKLDEETITLKKDFQNNLWGAAGTLDLTHTLTESSSNVNITNSTNKSATKKSSNFLETNESSPFKQSGDDKVQTVEANNDKQEIFFTPLNCQDKFEITQTFHQTNEETSLPDVCKLEGSISKISKYGSNIEESNIRNYEDKSDTYTSSEIKFVQEDSLIEPCPKGFVNKGFIETYRYALGSGKRPLTTDSTHHSSELSFESPSIDEKLLETTLIPPGDYKREIIQRSDSFKAYRDNNDFASRKCFTDSETNDDILKELEALDIKPEDTLSYSSSKNGPTSPIYTKDSCSYRGKQVTEKMTNTYLPSDRRFSFVDSKNESDDFFSEKKTSQKYFQNHFRENKAVSLDTCTGRETSTMLSEGTYKSLFRSATVAEDDDSLYMNSYKNHGRLLIEKGELDTFQNLTEKPTNLSDKALLVKKPIVVFDRSAYELKEESSVSKHSSFSQFLPRDSNLPELSEIAKTDDSSFRSEDRRSVSPNRYRFPSASPVRKRLDPLQIEPSSSNSTLIRIISPSPQHTSKSKSKESSYKSFDDYLSDYSYRDATDFKKYHSRTESLDFETKKPDRPFLHQRKRADSYDISSTEKVSQDQKSPPTSPLKFNPFPVRSSSRQPKELGIKLGLYLPHKSDKSPSKRLT